MSKIENDKDIQSNASDVIEVHTLSKFTVIEELNSKLAISGILLAEGVWKGVLYSKNEIKKMYDNFKDKLSKLSYKVEHENTDEFTTNNVGVNTDIEWSDTLGAILYKANITDPRAINLIKNGTLKGTSMKLELNKVIDNKGNIKGVDLKPIDNSLTSDPACLPSQIIISREVLNNKGESETQTFSITEDKPNEKKEISIVENDKVSTVLSEKELEHIQELFNEFIKRKRITYEYQTPKETTQSAPILNLSEEFSYQKYNDKFIVFKSFNSENDAISFVNSIKGKSIFLSKDEHEQLIKKEELSENPEIPTTGNFDIIEGIDTDITNVEELMWDVTDNYIRSGHSKGSFDEKSFRTVTIDKSKGIKGIIACPSGHYNDGKCDISMRVKSYLFPKDKFTKKDAQSWFKSHAKMSNKVNDNVLSTDTITVNDNDVVTSSTDTVSSTTDTISLLSNVHNDIISSAELEAKEEKPIETPVAETSKEEPKIIEQPAIKEIPKVEQPVEEKKPEPIIEQPKQEIKEEPKQEITKPVEKPKIEIKVEETKKEEIKEEPKVIEPIVQEKPKEEQKPQEVKEEPKIEEETPKEENKESTDDDIVKQLVEDQDKLADLLFTFKRGN